MSGLGGPLWGGGVFRIWADEFLTWVGGRCRKIDPDPNRNVILNPQPLLIPMKRSSAAVAVVQGALTLCVVLAGAVSLEAALPAQDERARAVRDLNTPRQMAAPASRAAWETRAREIREQVLVSCGLWPMPERTPLKPQVSGRVERDGYSIENVAIQTYPGFYLAGNLYRPLGRGKGPFPAVLNPHGHWASGRMADQPDGSLAARCIHFARQGIVAFSYDMVGYNDTIQVTHKFGADPANQLWGISLMGLQTWNSVRALDFLASLPDVDRMRLGCTGESGGGTQTFMLGAIDDRLAVQGPIVMVSHTMQGGCLCENAPGLRSAFYNVEIAAAAAPRPQILVAAAGDWTKATLEVEGPDIESVYRLCGASDRFRAVSFNFGHNYNQTSREAAYAWFQHWLLGQPDRLSVPEAPYTKEPDAALRVFPDGKLPPDALNEAGVIHSLVALAKAQVAELTPRDPASLDRARHVIGTSWRRALGLDPQPAAVEVEAGTPTSKGSYSMETVAFGRTGAGDRIPAVWIKPVRFDGRAAVVLAHPAGGKTFLDADGAPRGVAAELLGRGMAVLLPDLFMTGSLFDGNAAAKRKLFEKYFTTYNRTDLQERVQDLATSVAYLRQHGKVERVTLCGTDRAGIWCLLASPVADGVAADLAGVDVNAPARLLESDLFVPGLLKFGGVPTVMGLAAPRPMLVHQTAGLLNTGWAESAYRSVRASGALRAETRQLGDAEVARWIDRNRR